MSSDQTRPEGIGNAEAEYWDAYERLKLGRPKVVPKGTPVSQNNVAKEAGRDPSALKKERYPKLVRAIQSWIDEQGSTSKPSQRQTVLASRAKRRGLETQLVACKKQRDLALSRLIEADAKILELTTENLRLKAITASNIIHLETANVK